MAIVVFVKSCLFRYRAGVGWLSGELGASVSLVRRQGCMFALWVRLRELASFSIDLQVRTQLNLNPSVEHGLRRHTPRGINSSYRSCFWLPARPPADRSLTRRRGLIIATIKTPSWRPWLSDTELAARPHNHTNNDAIAHRRRAWFVYWPAQCPCATLFRFGSTTLFHFGGDN